MARTSLVWDMGRGFHLAYCVLRIDVFIMITMFDYAICRTSPKKSTMHLIPYTLILVVLTEALARADCRWRFFRPLVHELASIVPFLGPMANWYSQAVPNARTNSWALHPPPSTMSEWLQLHSRSILTCWLSFWESGTNNRRDFKLQKRTVLSV